MAHGFQRNEAESSAFEVRTAGSYQKLYESNRLLFSVSAIGMAYRAFVRAAVRAMERAWRKMFVKPVLTEIKKAKEAGKQ